MTADRDCSSFEFFECGWVDYMTPVERLNATFGEVSRLIDSVNVLQLQKRDSLTIVSELKLECAGLQAKCEELQAECREVSGRHFELFQEYNKLSVEYANTLIDLKRSREICLGLETAESELKLVLSSRSWRMTKPLRFMRSYLIIMPYRRLAVWLGRD